MAISPASSSPNVRVLKCLDELVIFFFPCSRVCPERGSVHAIILYSYVKHFVQILMFFLTLRHSIDISFTNCLLSSGLLYSRLQRVTIPDAVIIQFVLLKMGMLMLETCRRL